MRTTHVYCTRGSAVQTFFHIIPTDTDRVDGWTVVLRNILQAC